MSNAFDLWKLVAGLGIFLVGMHMLEDAIKILSGKTFRRMIRFYTNGRLRSIGSGVLVTAILQSSSAVSLMVLAFVGAGVMSMGNAIGVIMGSNIGTTLTVWIVAIVGFKLKIESIALPFIGLGGIALAFCDSSGKPFQVCRLLVGFGFLFLGLDFMKGSVENIGQNFDLSSIPNYGLWVYLLVGVMLTAIMQASAASIAIVLTALNSQLITFDIGVAMVIGANVGTTITVILGSLGGIPAKKRVAFSHLVFNVTTGLIAFLSISVLVWLVSYCIDIRTNSVMGLALFHTIFNSLGVILFLPFVGRLVTLLDKMFPDHRAILTVYINNTPVEETEAATSALRKENLHLLQECQLYCLRLLKIDEKLVFEQSLPLGNNSAGKKQTLVGLYENIKLLHAEIIAFYARLQSQKMEEAEAKDLERLIFSSRNIMNSIKNFKGIRHNLDEFDGSEKECLNAQYRLFRKRLLGVYNEMGTILGLESKEEQYQDLLKSFVKIETTDKRCIKETIEAVAAGRIKEMEIASLLLANRLFTQACRLQIFGMKDTLLTHEQINNFDRALDMKDILEAEKKEHS